MPTYLLLDSILARWHMIGPQFSLRLCVHFSPLDSSTISNSMNNGAVKVEIKYLTKLPHNKTSSQQNFLTAKLPHSKTSSQQNFLTLNFFSSFQSQDSWVPKHGTSVLHCVAVCCNVLKSESSFRLSFNLASRHS